MTHVYFLTPLTKLLLVPTKFDLTWSTFGASALSIFSNWAVLFKILTVRPPVTVIMTKAESSRPNLPNFIAETVSLMLKKLGQNLNTIFLFPS